jgi:hypothetical protein
VAGAARLRFERGPAALQLRKIDLLVKEKIMNKHLVMKSVVLSSLVIAMTSLIASIATGSPGSTWNKLELESTGLSVLMPGTVIKKEIHTASFIGDVVTEEYYVNDGRDSYSVETTDLPGFAVVFSGSDGIFDHAKGALLSDTFSKAISFTDVVLNGANGKALVYDTPSKPDHPEMHGEARFFLIDDRLYVADAVVEMDGAKQKLDRFFSSLAIKN